jgi:chloride channel protein, CIC family
MSLVIGLVSAYVAAALVWLIGFITNLAFYQRLSGAFVSPDGNHLGIWVVAIPVVGGLIIGLMARYGSDKIRGHGIPEALEAILVGRSRMDVKVALLKPLSSALSIGTGGPFGAEGPIIMTGGAFGSLFAQMFNLSSAERKVLLVAGASAGMAAIFAAPVAAVLLAVELLLFEWKPRSLVPVAIASAVAGTLRTTLLGAGPIFPVSPHSLPDGKIMAVAFVVGLTAGLVSALMTTLVYKVEDFFSRIPIHWMWWPALGGLVVGIGGYFDPRVMGVGYDVIGRLLHGDLVGPAVAGLLILKVLVWTVALGSGTSGGVLAPLLIIGGGLGALEAQWIPTGDAGLWAMVGMAAVMGGTMRSPLTAVLFAFELTHDVNMLPTLLVGCIASHALTVLVLRRSILTEKVARRGYHITREYSIDPLEALRVGEVMDREVQTIPATTTVGELQERIFRQDPSVTRHHAVLLANEKGELAGIVTRTDVARASQLDRRKTLLDAGKKDLITAFPDELVKSAAEKMLLNDVGRLPVVRRDNPTEVVGYLGRSGILQARRQIMKEEKQRERGVTTIPYG